jgi:hypothetical protein
MSQVYASGMMTAASAKNISYMREGGVSNLSLVPNHCDYSKRHTVGIPIQWPLLSPFPLREFEWENRKFILRRSVSCKPNFEDGLWSCECEEFGLYAYAETLEETLIEFHEDFAVIWDCIALEDDARLTLDAQSLKQRLLKLVKKVIDL